MRRHTLLLWLLFGSIAGGLWLITGAETLTNDIYWHIKAGEDFIEELRLQKYDRYSFTYHGREISNYPVLFQVTSYFLVKNFGYDLGTHIYLFTIFFTSLALVFWLGIRLKADINTLALALITAGLLFTFRVLVRPELVAYIFIVICFYRYHRTINEWTIKNHLYNFVLMAVWAANYGIVFGYVIFFGMYIDRLVFQLKERNNAWSLFILSGLALILAGFCNPYGSHFLWDYLHFDQRWTSTIVEYWNIFYSIGDYIGAIPIFLLILMALLLSVRARSFGHVFIVAFTTYAAIETSRIYTYLLLITLLVLLIDISRHRALEDNPMSQTVRIIQGIIFVSFAALFTMTINRSDLVRDFRPTKLADYFLAQNYQGNVINPYEIGGYLIYRLYPSAKVMIDGRSGILYDFEFFEKINDILMNAEKLRNYSRENNANFLITPNIPDGFHIAYKSGDFSADFVDDNYVLFTKAKGGLLYSGFVYGSPYCWKEEYIEEIRDENERIQSLAGLSSIIEVFQREVVNFHEEADKRAFLQKQLSIESSDGFVRFLGYRALELGEYDLAYSYLASSINFQNRDYLAAAYAKIKMGLYEEAEIILQQAMELKGLVVEDRDRAIMLQLINVLSREIDVSKQLTDAGRSIEGYLAERVESLSLGMNLEPNFCNVNPE